MAKKELMAAVKAYYDSQGWHYDYKPERNMIEMIMGLREINTCRVITSVRDDRFVTYCIFPLRPAEDKRAKVGEYLHRANYGLNIGNFEMDYEDGEIRYKANILCGDQIPEMSRIERLVDVGMDMINRYAPGILRIMYGNAEPKEMIDMIEGADREAAPSEGLSEQALDAMLDSLISEGTDGLENGDLLSRIRELREQMSEEGEESEKDGEAEDEEE